MTLVSETATLAYGYTMGDIDHMARSVARYAPSRESRMLDPGEARDVAWHAIIVALYEAETEPSRYDLIGAGNSAVSTAVNRLKSERGVGTHGSDFAPSFTRYWSVRHLEDDDFTERIVERLALPVVLSVLTPKQYEAIATLAAYDNDMRAAAAAAGVYYPTFASRVSEARRKILAVWFEHETPRRKKRTEEKCPNGHSRADHGFMSKDGRRKCRICKNATHRRWWWRAGRSADPRRSTPAEADGGPSRGHTA